MGPRKLVEVSAVDKNIKSIKELRRRFPSIGEECACLNLHCNVITLISGLSSFLYLTELNLSDNRIEQIGGLSALSQLRILNLATNQV